MADCGDLFLRKQQAEQDLELLRQASDALTVNGRAAVQLSIDRVPGMSEDELAGLYNSAAGHVDSDEMQRQIREAMGQLEPVAIGEGQPTNFRMLLAKYGMDEDTVLDYAQLHQMLVSSHQKVDPGDYAALVQSWDGDRLADFLAASYADMGITKDSMKRLASNSAPFARAIERSTVVRMLANGFQQGWHMLMERAASEIENGGLSAKTNSALLQTYGHALVATRHWDLIRRRTGQTLRAMGQELEFKTLTADDIENALDEAVNVEPDVTTGVPLKPAGPGPTAAGPIPAKPEETYQGSLDTNRGRQAPPRPPTEATPPMPAEPIRATPEETTQRAFDLRPKTPMPEERLVPDPGALGEGTLIGEVVRLLSVGKSNPKQAAADLRRIAAMGRLEKLNMKDTFATPYDYYNHMALYANSLGKDFMLTNLRTQGGINLPSNVLMALFKPVQQFVENVGMVKAYGTSLTRDYMVKTIEAQNASMGDALTMTWARGRQLFFDSWEQGRNIYSSNKDIHSAIQLNTRHVEPNDVERMYQQELLTLTMPTLSEVPNGPENAAMRVALSFGKMQAAVRIKAMEAGVPLPYTRTGHRLSSAVDNVNGFFLFNFRMRNHLHMEARMRAGELGLDTEQKIAQYVNDRASQEFAYYRPSRNEILERRKTDPKIDPTWSDSEVGMLIADERTAKAMTPLGGGADLDLPGYWAPNTESDLAREAWRFSEEGRFAQQIENPVLKATGSLRGKWWGDAVFPFWQIPMNGTMFDIDLAKNVVPPIFGLRNWKNIPTRQKARYLANWTLAVGVLGSFVALDAMDGDEENMVIGNGPVSPRAREAWLTKLAARGRKPNTVMGMPVQGIPILNTLMLWRDIKENLPQGEYNKSDQANILIGIAQVLASVIARMPGVTQIQQIQGLLSADKSSWADKTSRFIGYMGGSYGIPEIGAVRESSRALGLSPSDVLRKPPPNAFEREVGVDIGFAERTLEFLKGIAYGAVPLTTAFATRREYDHLGNKIRRPWGIGAIGDKDPHAPQIWPEGETRFYAELDRMGLLNTPIPLRTRTLSQVSMSPELQNEYIDHLTTIKGDENVIGDLSIENKLARVNFKALLPVDLQRGLRMDVGINLGQYPLQLMLPGLVKGRTRVEALRAAVNSPPYQHLAHLPKSADPTLRRESLAAARKILTSVDDYYQTETLMRIRASSSPAAQEWKKVRQKLDQVQSIQEGVPRMLDIQKGLMLPPVAEPAR